MKMGLCMCVVVGLTMLLVFSHYIQIIRFAYIHYKCFYKYFWIIHLQIVCKICTHLINFVIFYSENIFRSIIEFIHLYIHV